MTREQVRQLVELAGVRYYEAKAHAKEKQWLTAVLLLAQSVEAGLVATVSCCEPELRALKVWPDEKRLPQEWALGALLRVARSADWLVPSLPQHTGPADALSGDIGDAVRFLLELRNLAAHPGKSITGGQLPGHDFTDDRLMAQVYPVLDGIAGAIFEKLKDVVLALPDPPVANQRIASGYRGGQRA
jgi:hypothetical protein